ncbi:hypothetical protein HPB52_003489 [Rhipicephalus sanguineus]|uniref:Uncharacterized protein n=1 Tax=Rhipicephalus sanguineus TaxID=34632 RepID=A0A9D4T3R0_RHISA|nr:hypothetical protein HPB52_003489 [Rhipicephalus sanguineus]
MQGSRLALASALSVRRGIMKVRANIRPNVVAADMSSRDCLGVLELCGIPVLLKRAVTAHAISGGTPAHSGGGTLH